MPLYAPVQKSNFVNVEPGSYVARIFSVVDLGTHDATYQGKPVEPKRYIRITWELPTELHEFEKDGKKETKPLVIGQQYTLSMGSKANLRDAVECIIGTSLDDEEAAGFDVFSLVGMECLLSITKVKSKDGSKEYSNIQSIGRLPKGMVCPPEVNLPVRFNIGEWDQKAFEQLPEFLQKKISESYERRSSAESLMQDEQDENKPPF